VFNGKYRNASRKSRERGILELHSHTIERLQELITKEVLTLPKAPIRIRVPDSRHRLYLLQFMDANGTADRGDVHTFQQGVRKMPLSMFLKGKQEVGAPQSLGSTSGDAPPDEVKACKPVELFAAVCKSDEGEAATSRR
jgi:hypothetical protein